MAVVVGVVFAIVCRCKCRICKRFSCCCLFDIIVAVVVVVFAIVTAVEVVVNAIVGAVVIVVLETVAAVVLQVLQLLYLLSVAY